MLWAESRESAQENAGAPDSLQQRAHSRPRGEERQRLAESGKIESYVDKH